RRRRRRRPRAPRLECASDESRCEAAHCAAHRVGSRRGTHCTSVSIDRAGNRPADGPGSRASARGVDGARVDAGALLMSWLRLHPTKQRRAPEGKRVVTLSPSQIRWLGALLLSTQLPMIAYVPLWVACLGTLLVGLRFHLVARSVKNRDPAPQIIRSWILGLLAVVTA